MIKILKGKMAMIRKNYYKNNVDAYINYLENKRQEYGIKAFNAVKDYNKTILELRQEVEHLEKDENLIKSESGKKILEVGKIRLKELEDRYDAFASKYRENLLTFDIKMKEMKARKQILIANKKIKLYCGNEFGDSFENDFNEVESILSDIEMEQEAIFRTQNTLLS
jgi:hypothetical protein